MMETACGVLWDVLLIAAGFDGTNERVGDARVGDAERDTVP